VACYRVNSRIRNIILTYIYLAWKMDRLYWCDYWLLSKDLLGACKLICPSKLRGRKLFYFWSKEWLPVVTLRIINLKCECKLVNYTLTCLFCYRTSPDCYQTGGNLSGEHPNNKKAARNFTFIFRKISCKSTEFPAFWTEFLQRESRLYACMHVIHIIIYIDIYSRHNFKCSIQILLHS
jgi:hypothetical protein